MNPTVKFLQALAQALAALALYADGHPMRAAARDRAHAALARVLETRGELRVSFLDGAVVVGSRVLPELRGWEWGARLAAAGVQRFEIAAAPAPSPEDLEAFIRALHARLTGLAAEHTSPATATGIRFGALGLAYGDNAVTAGPSLDGDDELLDTLAQIPLSAESAAVRWIHEQVADGADVPLAEVELVVSSLSMAMHQEQVSVLPLLDLRSHDQYHASHACNVATLAIAVAEQLGVAPADARTIGMAALVHDIGNSVVPTALLLKAAPLTEAEFALVRAHTTEGARILSARGRGHALAATVAYEHHRWDNGAGGYPHFQWPRRCHFASRLVRVCDMYDAMRSRRPYRGPLSQVQAIALLQTQSGVQVQGEIVQALVEVLAHTPEVRVPVDAAQPALEWAGATARSWPPERPSGQRADDVP